MRRRVLLVTLTLLVLVAAPARAADILAAFAVFSAEVQVNGQHGLVIDTNALPTLPQSPNYNFGGTTVTAGRRIEFAVTVSNVSVANATNVRVDFMLPFGTSLIENTLNPTANVGNASGRCSTAPAGALRNEVICIYSVVTPSQAAAPKLQLLVDPGLAFSTQLSIEATASSDQTDTALDNNVVAVLFDARPAADVALTKAAGGPLPWTAGQLRTLRYDVSNAGPSVAHDLRLSDQLPAEVEFVGAWLATEGEPGSVALPCAVSSDNLLVCSLGDTPPTIGSGPLPVVLVDVRVRSDVADGSALASTAQLASDSTDPFVADNSSGPSVAVVAEADVRVAAVAVDATPAAGKLVTYRLTVTNDGPSFARGVALVATLSTGTSYFVDSRGCWTSSGDPTQACALGDLAPAASLSVDLVARVDAGARDALAATATVTSTSVDPDVTDNSATALARPTGFGVDDAADLALAMQTTGKVSRRRPLSFVLTVSNAGPATAENVVVVDQLPAGFVLRSTSETCTVAETLLTCALGNLAPGDAGTLTITGTVSRGKSAVNGAYVVADTLDPERAGNYAAQTAGGKAVVRRLLRKLRKSRVAGALTARHSATAAAAS